MRNCTTVLALLLVVSGCGPATGRGGNGPDLTGGGGDEDLYVGGYDGGVPPADLKFDSDAFWAKDPPPMYCALDGGAFPPPMVPGGTPDCPDDKNREGCPCPKDGMTAACWPGLRANRNLGICMDGTTTCQAFGELGLAWGPCMGYVLPDPNGTGKSACTCFSGGQWAIANLSPCFYDSGGGPGSAGATSTVVMNGQAQCIGQMGMLVKPNAPWSPDTVTTDCEGHFKMCYTLKAGDGNKPLAQDCVLTKVCVEADYTMINQAQKFPDLPAWVAGAPADIACATAFAQKGGYGEMSVDGITIMCDKVQKVFNRVIYCPLSCNMNPNDPMCKNCMQGGGGNF
jgi:hypothetical protein